MKRLAMILLGLHDYKALVAQSAEATDSNPVQCQFESDQGYQKIRRLCNGGSGIMILQRLCSASRQSEAVSRSSASNRDK
jgi:hypothetical protein